MPERRKNAKTQPKPEVSFRPLAEEDLTGLYFYIAEQSGFPDRAIEYLRRLRDYCDALAEFPKRGRERSDLRPGVWVAGFEKRVAIVYVIARQGGIEVGRVFYGGRDYETLVRESVEGEW